MHGENPICADRAIPEVLPAGDPESSADCVGFLIREDTDASDHIYDQTFRNPRTLGYLRRSQWQLTTAMCKCNSSTVAISDRGNAHEE